MQRLSSKKSKKWASKTTLGALGLLVLTVLVLRPPNLQQQQPGVVQRQHKATPHSFVEQHCNLERAKWYPGGWQQRTPAFLLAGAKKSGTTSLSRYLAGHSQIQLPRTKELRFFLPNNFEHLDSNNKTLVYDTRQYMYQHDYRVNLLKNDQSLLGFEATPGYLFQSTTSPHYILCACPWVKILVILRNPVDRVWSNYNFYLTQGVKLGTFENWVQKDMNLLREAGMLNLSQSFVNSEEEYQAWDMYLKKANEGPVGRSLYEVQLRHWYQALREIGRDPTKEVLVVRNEDLKRDPQDTLNRIYKWLGLPPQSLPETMREFMVSKYEERTMSNETRNMLEHFYRPYNQRLYDLLGGDWQGVYDESRNDVDRDSDVEKVYAGRKKRRPKAAAQAMAERRRKKWQDAVAAEDDQDAASQGVMASTGTQNDVYGTPSFNTSVAMKFANKWCEMRDVAEWYPSGQDAWQLRAPYFMLPGAKKSGTTSLASYIAQHPKVVKARTKELQFFLNKNFRAHYVRDSDRKTLVKEARLAYEREFRRVRLQKDPSTISMDATPGYLFFSAMLPQRILCVCPWIKLVVILRNPVDRVYSNYAYQTRMGKRQRGEDFQMAPFDKYVQSDIKLLRQAGVLPREGGKTLSVAEEDEAWKTYLGLAAEGQVGRSLYAIQLRQWFRAFREIGRDPKSQIHIVRSEDMKKDAEGEYRKVLEFLGLPYHPLESMDEKVVSNYTSLLTTPMANSTRTMLEKLFAPYNKGLYDMLGGDWDGYWESKVIE